MNLYSFIVRKSCKFGNLDFSFSYKKNFQFQNFKYLYVINNVQ